MSREPFVFTITDAARFLGKSPVTLRKWEREGLVDFPRLGMDRRFETKDIRDLASTAFDLGRIPKWRRDLVLAGCTIMETLEYENRRARPTRGRKE